VERIYPDLQDAPDPDIQDKESHISGSFNPQRPLNPSQEPTPPQSEPGKHPTSPQVVHPPVLVPTRPVKKVLKRKIWDEDPFLDNVPASSPASGSPVTKGHPPVLKEGPYRNSYVFAQPTAEAVWPPERKRKSFELPNAKLSTDDPLAFVAPTEHNQSTALKQQPHQHRRQRVKQDPNAVASSSKVKLSATAVQLDGLLPNTSAKLPPSKTEHANKRQKTENHSKTSNHHSHRDVVAPSPSDSNVIVYENPVVDTTSLPRIDFRQSLQNRLLSLSSTSRRGSIYSSRASASASRLSSISRYVRRRESAASTSSRHRRPSVISEKDLILFSLFKREMERLGNEYGFSGDIVRNTYAETGSFENTRSVLAHMNVSMRAAQQGIYEARPDLFERRAHENDDDDDSFPEGVIPVQSTPGQKQRGKIKRKSSVGKALGQKIRSSLARYARPSLNYKPLSGDEQDALSDYSPPSRTRARRYWKLQKEGREEEAIAVAFGDSPIRHSKSAGQEISGYGARDREVRPQVTTIRRGMEPSSPLETQPSMGEDAMSVDGNEFVQLDSDAEDDGGAEAEDSDVFSDKRQSTRKMASDEDAAQLACMEEHKRISAEVTIDNQDEMRVFEQQNDADLLRRWSANWIRERVTGIREAQERRREHDRITTAEKARESRENYGLMADESGE